MDTSALKSLLRGRQALAPHEVDQLEPRKKEELEFHDLDRGHGSAGANDHSNRRFYTTTRQSLAYIDSWLSQAVPGKVFLDYGCGNGSMAIKAAKMGAALAIGLDISQVSVDNATRSAAEAGVGDTCVFVQGDCENTALPDRCVDVVLCGGMLHHVDLTVAFPELRRIMTPGARALAVEALGYNPVIQMYRRRTPHLRTKWESEHILSMKDVRLARRYFDVRQPRHWHLFSLGAVALPDASIVKEAALKVGEVIDSVVLRLPGIRLMSWQFSFEFVKADR